MARLRPTTERPVIPVSPPATDAQSEVAANAKTNFEKESQMDGSGFGVDRRSLEDLVRPAVPDVFSMESGDLSLATLEDDEAFMEALRTLRSQNELLREYVSASEKSSRRSDVLAIASLVVAALSLLVSLVSLLSQFDVIG